MLNLFIVVECIFTKCNVRKTRSSIYNISHVNDGFVDLISRKRMFNFNVVIEEKLYIYLLWDAYLNLLIFQFEQKLTYFVFSNDRNISRLLSYHNLQTAVLNKTYKFIEAIVYTYAQFEMCEHLITVIVAIVKRT
jgi:hypothetical protein